MQGIRSWARHMVVALLCVASSSTVFGQGGQVGVARDVRLTLALEGDRQVFRMGEPIRASLTFEGEYFSVLANNFVASDEWRFSPSATVSFWRDRFVKIFGPGDVTLRAVPRSEPVTLRFALGDRVRFDAPGVYSLAITTDRTGAERVTSNTISFHVVAMSEAEAAAEVVRLGAAIDALPDSAEVSERARRVEQLAALTGEAATREHVRRILARPADAPLYWALYRSADSTMAIALLEQALLDVTRVPSSSLVGTVVNLRLWQSGTAEALEPDPDSFMLRGQRGLTREYARKIRASLPLRSAGNQRETALMLNDLSWAMEGGGRQRTAEKTKTPRYRRAPAGPI